MSVVVPTQNRVHLLRRALASIRAQSTPPFEIIVVDDGSAPSARAPLEALAVEGVQLERHGRPRGAGAARNTGIRAASGEWVAFLDDDDEWLPRKLELQLEALADDPPNACASFTGVHLVSGRTGRIEATRIPGASPRRLPDFLASTGFMTSVVLVSRQALLEVGLFDESLCGGQDHDLWIRLSENGGSFAPVRTALVKHHVHGDQITCDLAAKIRSKEAILAKHRDRYARHPAALARQLQRLGMLHCAGGSLARGRACFADSLRLDPERREAQVHLEHSLQDADAHRALLLESAFDRIDGITRFY